MYEEYLVLDADDIDDTNTTNKFVTQTEKDAWDDKAETSDIGNGTISVTQAWVGKGSFTMNQSWNGSLTLTGNKVLTQSEYDALPASKATDGNTHFIYETITTD